MRERWHSREGGTIEKVASEGGRRRESMMENFFVVQEREGDIARSLAKESESERERDRERERERVCVCEREREKKKMQRESILYIFFSVFFYQIEGNLAANDGLSRQLAF